MTLEQRIEQVEFRQQLLFENSDYSRLLFEYNLTCGQRDATNDVFDDYRRRIEAGESVSHGGFEQAIYAVVPHQEGNYHFVEALAQTLHADRRWDEVFVALYGDQPKFQTYLNSSSRV